MTIMHKVFAANSVFKSDDLNNYLMNQTVVKVDTEAELLNLPANVRAAFVTGTGAIAVYDGTAWRFFDSQWKTFNVVVSTSASPYAEINYGNAIREGRYIRRGRTIEVSGLFQLGSTTTYNGNVGPVRLDYPAGLRPSNEFFGTTALGRGSGVARVGHINGVASGLVAHEYNANQNLRRMFITYMTNDSVLQGGNGSTWNVNSANHFIQFYTSYEI